MKELRKALKSNWKNIAEHKGYLKDPTKHVKDWAEKSREEQCGLMRHWEGEIDRWLEQVNILEELIKLAGE